MNHDAVRATDPEIAELLDRETSRQKSQLEMIASENFASEAVIQTMGSTFTNKYAEGLPGKRYYGGCEVVDVAENLAIDRAKRLFGAEHANVQPHSGAQANQAVFLAFLEPGDPILGMDLSHGGHLTHGSKVNISGKYFDPHFYGVREDDGRIDYDVVREKAREVKPKMIIAGASAYTRTIDFAAFGEIAREVGAKLLVDMAHIAGLVAAGIHPSPVPHADAVTTTTHKTLRGPRGGLILTPEVHAKAIDKAVFPGNQGGPLMHVIASKAVAFGEALQPSFTAYAKQVVENAKELGNALLARDFRLVSGGTDNHLLLVDLRPSHPELSGKDAEHALEAAGITVNKNTVPGETRSPFVTSGLRIGTPALTTRGMGPGEMHRIGEWMARVLSDPTNERLISRTRSEVEELCAGFPLYAAGATVSGTAG